MDGEVAELPDDAFNGSNAFRKTGVKAVMVAVQKPGWQEAAEQAANPASKAGHSSHPGRQASSESQSAQHAPHASPVASNVQQETSTPAPSISASKTAVSTHPNGNQQSEPQAESSGAKTQASGLQQSPEQDKQRHNGNLLARHKPARLADIHGQARVVRSLSAFAAAPHSNAFMFAGSSGVGKTAAAWALANELGCAPLGRRGRDPQRYAGRPRRRRPVAAHAPPPDGRQRLESRHPEYQNVMRETPWGIISYLEYRRKVEFGFHEYNEIDRYCRDKGILWFASCWDEDSVDFIEQFSPPCYKIASASLTDIQLLNKIRSKGRPIILSTGMSTFDEIEQGVTTLGTENLAIAHSTSTYPCPPGELNLRMIKTLQKHFNCPVGYSGHEVGLQTTLAAITLGAAFVERHITLDRAMWGSDQAASVEPWGLMRLVRDIRVIEQAMGDGIKQVYPSEMSARQKLRRKA